MSAPLSWVKFTQPIPKRDIKAGEIKELPDVEAKSFIDMGFAEVHTQPPEVDAGVAAGQGDHLAKLFELKLPELVDAAAKKMIPAAEQRAKSFGIGRIHDNAEDDPTMGFKSLGEQCRIIKGFYQNDPNAHGDVRMKRMIQKANAPTTYANEGSGSDGGFLLAPNYIQELMQYVFPEDGIMGVCDKYTTASNSLTVPKDETTPWSTTGIQAYWTAEAAQITPTKPVIGQDNIILQKLSVLVPMTDEQLSDAFVGMGNYVAKKAGQMIRFAAEEAIINGTGAGKPLGVLNAGCIVSQAAVSAQTAATVNITNIAAMLSRQLYMMSPSLRWLVHPSVMPQLVILTNGNNSLYIGPGQVESKSGRLATLMGIPVVVSQHCQVLGTAGDILLLDFGQYLLLTKGGIDQAMSIHLYFDYNVSTFRFNFRIGGQPWPSTVVTSLYGNFTQSPFTSLATRS